VQLSAGGLEVFRARFLKEWDGAVPFAAALAARDNAEASQPASSAS